MRRLLAGLGKVMGARTPGQAAALYDRVVALGRAPHWYLAGGVPDSVTGRFNIISTVLSIVLLRLEAEEAGIAPSVWLTERFIDDMEGQLRQEGVGDTGVGKHMGQLVSLLGGRLGAYRDGLATGAFDEALVRNLYGGTAPEPRALDHARDALLALRERLAGQAVSAILAGDIA
ncbi:ubiquinol-cytochrome C chaperone family protein [Sphingomonas sp.]|uniref:ubiquinol-cytochrome C chaperone family protein n=1 Tax=Sphingomonas sp. TaxID=28214 RepID=UPI001D4F620B|nr:ubiquinol-cytochrome C chaperone family protein [Sphingomonas sp.]MBX9795555.1 ubiquinol-cytochrome C chaperone [Sphingomonas sp.]